MFILSHPILTEYFTVKCGQEMDLAPVIAINVIYYNFFLYFSCLSRGSVLTGTTTVNNKNRYKIKPKTEVTQQIWKLNFFHYCEVALAYIFTFPLG